jgi:hypothetical protein
MANLYEQRNLSMTPDQWRALEAAAIETNSRSTRGPDAYQPSWRKLIQRIADGDLLLREKEPYALPPGLSEAADKVERRQRPGKTPAKMTQLSILELEPA